MENLTAIINKRYDNSMLGLNQDTVNLITIIAIVSVSSWLAIFMAAALSMQFFTFD